jgi:ribose/xylose/arabinose/galactoside ABC-type transport system permease subunit
VAGTDTAPDRLVLHLAWEGVLAIVAIILIIAVLFRGDASSAWSSLILQAAPLGLAASAIAFSLRTGAPNLAVGAIAAFTGGLAAKLTSDSDWSVGAALVVGVLLATVIGFVLGLLVAVLSVPAWVASIGAMIVVSAIHLSLSDGGRVLILRGTHGGTSHLWFWLFVLISIAGAAIWLIPAVRQTLSARRRPAEPGRWAGLQSGLGAIVGLTVSSFLAGLAGVVLVLRLGAASADPGTYLLGAALAAAVLGGVSVYGRRAGLLGVVFATLIVASTQMLLLIHGQSAWVTTLVPGLLLLLGLGVNRVLETVTDLLGKRRVTP